MKVHIIGYRGVVGNATYQLFKSLGYEVTGSDDYDDIEEAAIYFICVPEDSVAKVVLDITRLPHFSPDHPIVVRSSVPPGTCKELSKIIPNLHISHNPEFAREAIAVQDTFNPSRIVIGQCCEEHGKLLKDLYRTLRCPIVITDPTTSELVKLASNNYLSCVISYWNTIEEIAKRIGVSGHQVGMIASMDPRISPYGARFHTKYEGRCLPKDAKQLIEFAESIGYNPILIKAIEEVNNQL